MIRIGRRTEGAEAEPQKKWYEFLHGFPDGKTEKGRFLSARPGDLIKFQLPGNHVARFAIVEGAVVSVDNKGTPGNPFDDEYVVSFRGREYKINRTSIYALQLTEAEAIKRKSNDVGGKRNPSEWKEVKIFVTGLRVVWADSDGVSVTGVVEKEFDSRGGKKLSEKVSVRRDGAKKPEGVKAALLEPYFPPEKQPEE